MINTEPLHKVTREELEKMWALHLHDMAYKGQANFRIPYKILLDYFSSDAYMELDPLIPSHPYYPLKSIPSIGIWHYDTDGHYTPDEWDSITAKWIPNNKGEMIRDPFFKIVPPEIEALKLEKASKYRLWDFETAAGLQAWAYYFMVFIMPYEDDIPHYTVFDMYGDTKHSERDLNERKHYYMELIGKCKEYPDIYKHEIMGETGDNISDLDILYRERETMPNYEKASKRTDTMQYRLKWLIEIYEQEQEQDNKPAADE